MGANTIIAQLQEALQAGNAPDPVVILNDSAGNAMLVLGTTVPTDAAAGYGTGCLFLHTDGGSEDSLYVNEGSTTSCDFNAQEVGLETTLALTTNGNGASKIGIEDAGSLIDGTTVEAALAEIVAETLLTTSKTLTAGAATAAMALRLGASATEGWEIKVIDETSAVLNAVTTDLTQDIPDGAVILACQLNIESALTGGGTTVKVGLGDGDVDPDLYGISADLSKNTKIDFIPDYAVLSGALSMEINACATGGGIGDTALTVGTVRVRIVYATLNSLDDAA